MRKQNRRENPFIWYINGKHGFELLVVVANKI